MSIYKMQGVVRGATQFAGNIDGEAIDANSIFVDTELNPEHGGYGSRTAPKRCLNKEVVDKIKHNPFPFVAEITLQEMATKGKETLIVTEIRPLKMGDGSTPAKQANA
jgi:hypothetical protein